MERIRSDTQRTQRASMQLLATAAIAASISSDLPIAATLQRTSRVAELLAHDADALAAARRARLDVVDRLGARVAAARADDLPPMADLESPSEIEVCSRVSGSLLLLSIQTTTSSSRHFFHIVPPNSASEHGIAVSTYRRNSCTRRERSVCVAT